MDTENLILIGAAAYLGYRFLENKPSTPAGASNEFNAMGYSAAVLPAASSLSGKNNVTLSTTTITGGNVTYLFNKDEYSKLNWAQRIFLNTHIVPVSWVLG